uniref:Fe2OG dioxygenase domain-containing protein n=1 Tax=Amorphochlora amoebiformis TaxID=1561963 RepID=A0A6T6YS23_9EUKA
MSVEVNADGTYEDTSAAKVIFKNSGLQEADLRWDNGGFGQVVAHRLAVGQDIVVNTYNGHSFIWTEHGTSRPISERIRISPTKKRYELTREDSLAFIKTKKCVDRYPDFCKKSAKRGECDVAPGWMIVHCPESCNQCDLQDPKIRCRREALDMDQEPIWKPGDLNARFEKILSSFPEYKVKALSQPPDGPWVLEFQDFIKKDEAARLIELNRNSFERSTDQGAVNEFGEMQKVRSTSRTSSNSWCDHNCESDPLVAAIYDRIVQVTGVPKANYEAFQVLQYQNGQFYRTHHDDSGGDSTPAGPRILTFFLYLSDVEEGGETDFPTIGVRAKPKAGSAILWPSMKDEDPENADPRMYHQAMPVIKGTKYAANAWIHLFNYRVPNLWGCTGSFT